MALFGKKSAKVRPPIESEPLPLDPMVSLILADVAVRTGETLVRRSIDLVLLKGRAVPGRVIRGRTITETVVGTVLAEVARRSVPGAILVGGGLIAKTLSDRRKAKRARSQPD
jgi:hypothetical protein